MKITPKIAKRHLEKRKAAVAQTQKLLDPSFPEQNNFIKDPSKFKALFCTRRAAKSYTAGLYMVKTALEFPGCNCLFVGLTRDTAWGIIGKDILKVINRKNNLNAVFNGTALTMTFPNSSVIRVTGVDSDEEEMNKLLGKKYKLVCIDEASLYTVDLRHMVYDILGPAMADQQGTICLSGTSSNFTRGLFYDITTSKEPGWSLHQWSAHQNPHIDWQKQLDEIKQNRPLYMETPQFRQWYLNEWVIETDKLVYKFNPEKNLYSGDLPYPGSKGWTYNLSIDTGWEDDNAFVLTGYHEHDPILYVIKIFKKNHMSFDQVLDKIHEFTQDPKFPISSVIIDGANKQGVESMKMRTDINFEYANKLGKVDHIEMLNGDLIQEKIKINVECRELYDEMMTLVWKTSADKIVYPKREHPSLPNHLCDAFLYGWFNGWHFLSTPSQKALKPGTREYIIEQERLHKEAIMERMKKEQQMKDGLNISSFPKTKNGRDPWNEW